MKKVSTHPGTTSEWKLTGTRAQFWQEKGLNKGGFLVCKYAFVVSQLVFRSTLLVVLTVNSLSFFQRLPGQPPIAVKNMDGDETDESSGESDAEGDEE